MIYLAKGKVNSLLTTYRLIALLFLDFLRNKIDFHFCFFLLVEKHSSNGRKCIIWSEQRGTNWQSSRRWPDKISTHWTCLQMYWQGHLFFAWIQGESLQRPGMAWRKHSHLRYLNPTLSYESFAREKKNIFINIFSNKYTHQKI